MVKYDLAIAWNWEFDHDFIFGIEYACAQRGITTYQITPHNLTHVLYELQSGVLTFRSFYDRASDADESFLPLVKQLQKPGIKVINPHHLVLHAIDKATMHLEFITQGLLVPYTIILPPLNGEKEVHISPSELKRLGIPFVIKPANTTGGGTGVILDAKTIHDVEQARKQHPDDKYLIQEKVHPTNFDGKRAWFRVYYVFGEVILCWWDDTTHLYTMLSLQEEEQYNLRGLRNCILAIQRICQLDFFSSEIAMTAEEKFVIVDYVNEICDMRLQSKYFNGAPDAVVHRIENLIAEVIEKHIRQLNAANQG